jgi:hypothetical protein
MCSPARVLFGNVCCGRSFSAHSIRSLKSHRHRLQVRETFAKGGRAYRTRIAHPTLGAVFIDPALRYLETKSVRVHLGERLRRIVTEKETLVALEVQDATIPLSGDDVVVLATPPWVTGELLPGIIVPDEFSAIVNAHYKIAPPEGVPGMLGLIGGTAEWVFAFPDRVSVTISGADRLIDREREELAALIWNEVCLAHDRAAEMPPWQIVKEKRATFRATPDQDKKRPPAETGWRGLYLAGDWTDTGLPATIEGSIRSGNKASKLALSHF